MSLTALPPKPMHNTFSSCDYEGNDFRHLLSVNKSGLGTITMQSIMDHCNRITEASGDHYNRGSPSDEFRNFWLR